MGRSTDVSPVRPGDAVQAIVDQWGSALPDLDASPLLVLGRLQRIADVCDGRLRPPFAAGGLAPGDFDVLAALRRSPPPHRLLHGDIARVTLVTPSAVTKRVDRLVADGLVQRTQDRDDARLRYVGLTTKGRHLTDKLIRQHMANEAAILADFSDLERRQLGDLLGRLLSSVDGSAPD